MVSRARKPRLHSTPTADEQVSIVKGASINEHKVNDMELLRLTRWQLMITHNFKVS